MSVVEAALAMDLRGVGVSDALKLALGTVARVEPESRTPRYYTSVLRAHVALGSADSAVTMSAEAVQRGVPVPKEVLEALAPKAARP